MLLEAARRRRDRRRPAAAGAAPWRGLIRLVLCGLTGLVAGFRLPVAPVALRIKGVPSLPSFAARSRAAAGGGAEAGAGTRSRRGWGQQHRPLASSLAVDPPANGDDGEGASEATPVVVVAAEEQHAVPSLGALLRFTIPTLGIWLAGPIMSLVRTFVRTCVNSRTHPNHYRYTHRSDPILFTHIHT